MLVVVAAQAQLRDPQFTLADLKSLVDQNGIKELDNLVEKLPLPMRQNALLVYDSHALNLPLVGPDRPRIILFNNDASLILALTQNPGADAVKRGDDKLEVMHFDHKTAEFEILDVAFDGRRKPFVDASTTQSNPALCLTCHGQNPHPIFQDYNAWPGFYGSFSQRAASVLGTQEFKFMESYLKVAPTLPRYRDLAMNIVLEPKGYEIRSKGFFEGTFFEPYNFSQNLAFGTSIEFLMEKRTAARLRAHREFNDYAALFSFLGDYDVSCGTPREKVKSVWKWLAGNNTGRVAALTVLAGKIEQQLYTDRADKLTDLEKFSKASVDHDNRGLITIPYLDLTLPDSRYDRDFILKQFALMETFFQYFGIGTDLVSTTRMQGDKSGTTSGIFHIRKLGLVRDESYFQLLYDGFVDIDKSTFKRWEWSTCATNEKALSASLAKIPIPDANTSGVLFR